MIQLGPSRNADINDGDYLTTEQLPDDLAEVFPKTSFSWLQKKARESFVLGVNNWNDNGGPLDHYISHIIQSFNDSLTGDRFLLDLRLMNASTLEGAAIQTTVVHNMNIIELIGFPKPNFTSSDFYHVWCGNSLKSAGVSSNLPGGLKNLAGILDKKYSPLEALLIETSLIDFVYSEGGYSLFSSGSNSVYSGFSSIPPRALRVFWNIERILSFQGQAL